MHQRPESGLNRITRFAANGLSLHCGPRRRGERQSRINHPIHLLTLNLAITSRADAGRRRPGREASGRRYPRRCGYWMCARCGDYQLGPDYWLCGRDDGGPGRSRWRVGTHEIDLFPVKRSMRRGFKRFLGPVRQESRRRFGVHSERAGATRWTALGGVSNEINSTHTCIT